MKNSKRTTLLINLSTEEAAQIRAAAKNQDRTISAYVLRAVMTRISMEHRLAEKQVDFFGDYISRLRRSR